MIKTNPRSSVYCIESIKAWFTPQDLLARFCKVNLSNTKKSGFIYYFGLSVRQRNATYKLHRVN